MKSLILLPIVLGIAFTKLPDIDYFSYPKPILIKPNKSYDPLIWYRMVNGVKHFEGFHATPYVCPAGVYTTGYGHTGEGTKLKRISEKKAESLLVKDLDEAKSFVLKYVKVPLNDGQMSCLISFTFNCGEGNLKSLVEGKNRLNGGNYKSVKRLLPQYCKADGRVLNGLVKRREWELKLWNDESKIYLVKN